MRDDASRGVLHIRPGTPPDGIPPLRPGVSQLSLGGARDGLILNPGGVASDLPAPLLVMLHGAGGGAEHAIALVRDAAEAAGTLVLAPESRGRTWDVILGAYGPDVAFLDDALAHLLGRSAVDPARLAVGGFSDGASYALSLALANGRLFTHALAFSPGFMAPARIEGRPRIYVSHGTGDTVLPIDRCSRRLAPALRQAGYDLLYREFDGGHAVPPDLAQEAVGWLATGRTAE